MSSKQRKPSQRERLLEAMTHVAAREGYAEMKIAHLTSRAGVSRQTFYECFTDKEDCFLAAYQQAASEILGKLQQAIDTIDWWETPSKAMRVLLEEMESDPETAWLFFVEGMAGGSRVRRHRNDVLAAFERLTEEFLDQAPADGMTLDIPPIAIVGAIRSIASTYLSTNSVDRLPALLDDLVAWMRSYAAPAARPRWSSGPHAVLSQAAFPGSGRAPTPILSRPDPLPRGRHNLPASMVARNHRERILHATAEIATDKGYVEMTVGDIVARAGIGKDVFYEHFHDKQSVFLATQQHALKDTFTLCASSYFAGANWPERIYNGLRMLVTLTAKEPALAHLRMVEPYAAGADAIEHMQEMIANFAVFLEEGYQYSPTAQKLPHLSSDAISGAVFEIIRREIAAHNASGLPRHLPELAYTAIAPFAGPTEAARLVEEMIAKRPPRL
ncbi:MAG: transcriptional regulator, TetR family, partial [Solirubrobacterales bacterium]|nr:transcriptional regulator, TetR family [Solirubrobacterales bacterium]